MRSMFLGLFLAATVAAAGCAADEAPTDDELAGESDLDGESLGKADGPDNTFTFFQVEQDFRKCLFPLCGGNFVSRVNRVYTRCEDGFWRNRCYVTGVNLGDTKLSDEQQDGVRAELNTDKVLVRGNISTVNYDGFGDFGQLDATEVWMGGSDNAPEGLFTRVKNNNIVCITTPCPSANIETKVNSLRSVELGELDLSWTGVSDEEIDGATAQVFGNDGLIVAGYRYYFWDGGWMTGRLAIQFYERMLPAPAPTPIECVRGGCSGQLCTNAADGPVLSTCEWRAEYACYQAATCEAQTDGTCGFTKTDELGECLANPPPL